MDKEFGILWTPDEQALYGADGMYRHKGPTNTYPTHDLAHVIVAASSNLSWLPTATGDELRMAEYNAVLMENLFDKTLYFVKHKKPDIDTILRPALKYLRWFVDKHFAPFPIPAEEAYRRFCNSIDEESVVRLSPYFFNLSMAQSNQPDFMQKTWRISFDRTDIPVPNEQVRQCQHVFSELISTITGPASSFLGISTQLSEERLPPPRYAAIQTNAARSRYGFEVWRTMSSTSGWGINSPP